MITRYRSGVLQNSTLVSLALPRPRRRTTARVARPVRYAPVNTSAPTITGTVRRGATLTAHTGTWTSLVTPIFTYQWQRCDSGGGSCVDILNADESQYIIQSADVGHKIRVVVTANV